MSEHKENVPKLRFPGFTGAWEGRYLSDVAQISSGGTPNRKESSYWNGTIPWATTAEVNYSVITDTKEKITLEGLNSSSAKLLSIGTILLAMYGQGKTRGKVAILGIEATTNQANANIAVSPIVNNLFIYYQLEKQYEILRNLANEGGQANLSLSIVKNISVSISSDLSEQEKIGNLFKQLDYLISLHRRKLKNVKNLKAGLLEKMFPKAGGSFPEIRFPGFTDAWEHRTWLDTVDISTNMVDPKTGDYDELPHIGPGNIESFTGILSNVRYVRDENLISSKFHFRSGDIIYSKIRPNLAKYVLIDFEGLASADAYVLNSKNGLEQSFLYRILQSKDFYDYSVSVSQRTGMPKINREELNQYNFLLPCWKEQIAIGNFFRTLDGAIILHQRKLEHLQEQKKALLQQMFV